MILNGHGQLILLLGGGLVLFPVGSALLGLGQNYLSIIYERNRPAR